MSKNAAQHGVHPVTASQRGTNCADPAKPQAGQAGGIRTAKLAFFVALDFGCFVGESRSSSRRPVA